MATVASSGRVPPPPPVWDAPPKRLASSGYGGFWIRAVASVVDAILVNFVSVIFGMALYVHTHTGDLYLGESYNMFLTFSIAWGYSLVMESSPFGATFGKMAVGLRVADKDGQRISGARAAARFLGKILSSVILGIGFIMVAFTDRKRGLHDMIAGTMVVKYR